MEWAVAIMVAGSLALGLAALGLAGQVRAWRRRYLAMRERYRAALDDVVRLD